MLSAPDISELSIRVMTVRDLMAALSLSTAAGWNQSAADWHRMLLLEPRGCFVAELHGKVIGTTLCCTFGRVAWLAMVIVDQAFRGHGIGRKLVQTGLDYAHDHGAQTVRLDATQLGEAVYRQLDFEPQFELIRMSGIVVPCSDLRENEEVRISVAEAIETSELLQLDFDATQTDRSKLLRQLFQEWTPRLANATAGKTVCFLASRQGRVSRQFGPCAGPESAAIALFQHGLNSAAGEAVIVDLPADAAALLSVARQFGLTEQRRLLRMCRGHKVTEDRRLYHASYGGEFG